MADQDQDLAGARFGYALPVRFADTDCQGHVYFSNYLVFCDEAMSAYLREIGCGWQRLAELGMEFFFVDCGCQFKGSARFEDRLTVRVAVTRMGNTSFTTRMAIFRERSAEPIASGFITSVMVDRATREPTALPPEFRQAVERYQSGGAP